MLAKVHIGLKELCIDDATYRIILKDMFGVQSAAQLSVEELEELIGRFESKGWKSKNDRRRQTADGRQKDKTPVGGQRSAVDALKERVGQELLNTDFTEDRLRGLARKICGVDDLRWCGDAVRLKRLLAAIGAMKDRGDIEIIGHG